MNVLSRWGIVAGLLLLAGVTAWARSPLLLRGTGGPAPPPAAQTLGSITQFSSSTTFPANTANAVVGTVTVTMNPATPPFGGSLSITGANSCGFHLSGGTQVQAGASGCSATGGPHSNGLYDDWNVVATQTGVPNSPLTQTEAATATGAGIACTVGPNYQGTIPAGAQAAGFTHCVANIDFSAPFFTTRSNWLDCAGAASPIWYLISGGSTCAGVNPATDSGVSVLDMHFDPSWWPTATSTSIQTATTNNGTASVQFPQAMYVEIKQRLPSSTFTGACPSSQSFCTLSDFFFWSTQHTNAPGYTCCQLIEWDIIETFSSGNPKDGANAHDWNNGFSSLGGINEPWTVGGYDSTQYNIYGVRVTTDGTTYSFCTYLNNTFIGSACPTGTYSASFQNAITDFLSLESGPYTNSYNFVAPSDYYIQWIHVFACSAGAIVSPGQGGVCNGSVLTGTP